MSNLYEYIKMAVHNIMANKGRSFLTMLGIIIGIASVIAIVSMGEGTKNQMNSEIDDIGGGQIAISVSDEAQTDEVWITADDIEAIRAARRYRRSKCFGFIQWRDRNRKGKFFSYADG